MTAFKSAKELVECIGGLFDWAKRDEEISRKLAATKMVIRLSYTEPEAAITIDCREGVEWSAGASDLQPDVQFSMKGDIGHKFWLGKVSLLIALAKRDIVSKGPISKVMKILPILKPMYAQYPKILEKKGRAELAGV